MCVRVSARARMCEEEEEEEEGLRVRNAYTTQSDAAALCISHDYKVSGELVYRELRSNDGVFAVLMIFHLKWA